MGRRECPVAQEACQKKLLGKMDEMTRSLVRYQADIKTELSKAVDIQTAHRELVAGFIGTVTESLKSLGRSVDQDRKEFKDGLRDIKNELKKNGNNRK